MLPHWPLEQFRNKRGVGLGKKALLLGSVPRSTRSGEGGEGTPAARENEFSTRTQVPTCQGEGAEGGCLQTSSGGSQMEGD